MPFATQRVLATYASSAHDFQYLQQPCSSGSPSRNDEQLLRPHDWPQSAGCGTGGRVYAGAFEHRKQAPGLATEHACVPPSALHSLYTRAHTRRCPAYVRATQEDPAPSASPAESTGGQSLSASAAPQVLGQLLHLTEVTC